MNDKGAKVEEIAQEIDKLIEKYEGKVLIVTSDTIGETIDLINKLSFHKQYDAVDDTIISECESLLSEGRHVTLVMNWKKQKNGFYVDGMMSIDSAKYEIFLIPNEKCKGIMIPETMEIICMCILSSSLIAVFICLAKHQSGIAGIFAGVYWAGVLLTIITYAILSSTGKKTRWGVLWVILFAPIFCIFWIIQLIRKR
ncbi:MAG: hypothetical protein PHX21_06435 [bacterium]|nr:hypothetical protein [bacterium]